MGGQGWRRSAVPPATCKIATAPNRAEHEDYCDRATDFNPFTLKA